MFHDGNIACLDVSAAAVLDLVQIVGGVFGNRIAGADAAVLVAVMAPHQGTGGAGAEGYDASVIAPQKLFLEILGQEEMLWVVHFVGRIAGVVADFVEQAVRVFAAVARDMIDGLGAAIFERLRRRRHFRLDALLDESAEDVFQLMIGKIALDIGPAVEGIVEVRWVGKIELISNPHIEDPAAESTVFVDPLW